MCRGFLLAALAFLAFSVGCAAQADEPPAATPRVTVPELTPVSADVPQASRIRVPRLASQSAQRRARKLTVRVRNATCLGVATGSGFAIDSDILVTNRHVLAGAEELDVSTWDGRTHDVEFASVGVLGDVGIADVDGRLPLVGSFGPSPEAGDLITAVGYPLGGPLTLSRGVVIDRVDGGRFGIPGIVVRVTARVRPGNSGGPLLDRRGRIAGIVYAIERATGFGLAIPVDTFRRLVRIGGFEDLPPCGAE
jgi:S1-C subfamily serine protease